MMDETLPVTDRYNDFARQKNNTPLAVTCIEKVEDAWHRRVGRQIFYSRF